MDDEGEEKNFNVKKSFSCFAVSLTTTARLHDAELLTLAFLFVFNMKKDTGASAERGGIRYCKVRRERV